MTLRFNVKHFEKENEPIKKAANLICKHTCNSSAIFKCRLHVPTINVEGKVN